MKLDELLAHPEAVAALAPAEARALLPEATALVLSLAVRANAVPEPSANGDGRLLTPDEAAAIAGTTREWVWRRCRRRDFADIAVHLSRKNLRIREGPFRTWLARQGGAR